MIFHYYLTSFDDIAFYFEFSMLWNDTKRIHCFMYKTKHTRRRGLLLESICIKNKVWAPKQAGYSVCFRPESAAVTENRIPLTKLNNSTILNSYTFNFDETFLRSATRTIEIDSDTLKPAFQLFPIVSSLFRRLENIFNTSDSIRKYFEVP
jgi:hypothetical protein